MHRQIDLGPFPAASGYDVARDRDAADPLSQYRDRFLNADPDIIYLDGNSLGRLPLATIEHMRSVVSDEWGRDLVGSWQKRWWSLPRDLGNVIAPLLGASPDSVIVADSTSVCLYKLALGALRERPGRSRIVTDTLNFPTDVYVLSAAAAAIGGVDVVVVDSQRGDDADEDTIVSALDQETALLSLSHVAFKSGYLYNMERLTDAAHSAGALALWDLSHSAGVIPMDLSEIDLAVGCTYKYLNGGPGSPAFLYVRPTLEMANPLRGWWGHAKPFEFDLEYESAAGVARFQTGTMPILSLAALAPALDLVAEAGIGAIRAKSIGLTSFLIDLADDVLGPLGFEIASPRNPSRRGSHVSLRHPQAWQVTQAMISEAAVIPDFREPDNIRFGLAPLYTSFSDIHTAVHRIGNLVISGRLDLYPPSRTSVT